jgi:predicted ATPase/class 3 adenylate cyclase
VRDLPSGTVTLLFTDVEGSTSLLEELGADHYAEALAEHRRRLREAFTRHRGVEVDTQGDAFFYAFARATDAVAAADDGQSALADGPMRVRMGVHTGEPLITQEGYVGTDVHRAARIAAAGQGGQVLISEQTARLLGTAPLRYLGEHRLKDVEEPLRLFQLGTGAFPPPRTLTASVVPRPTTPLVGRKRELAEILRLLARERARLVTVTGPGGVGKTRLALELAAELVADMADGVFVVDLSAVTDAALVLPTIASTLGAKRELHDHITDKELLLVLDNMEQVADAAQDVTALLAACGRLQLLVASREPLHVAAEREYPLRPLPETPAVELFRQRAGAVKPDFEAPQDVLAELCLRLDNLPLAIELAAARVKVLSASELLARLERRLPLLTSRTRDVPERQRTLRATIKWSYELLDEGEQQLFRRLSVFVGGFRLGAAEVVASADLNTLELLVDKSLLRHEDGRYSMLETVREYAGDRLEECGEAEDVRRSHVAYFRRTAVFARDDIVRLDKPGRRTMQLVSDEIGNYRAALEWLLARGDVEVAAEIASPLTPYWFRSAQPQEAVVWLERLLENEAALAPATRARIRSGAARMLEFAGDRDGAEELYEQALREARAIGDEASLQMTLLGLGGAAMRRGDLETAHVLLDESLSLSRSSANPMGLTVALGTRGVLARMEGDREGADRYLHEALAVAREHRTISLPPLLQRQADFALDNRDIVGAARLYRESLEACVEGRMAEWIPGALGGIATTAAERGELRAAGRLWGARETLEQQRGRPISRVRDQFEARIGSLAKSDPAAFEAAVEEGHRLPTDEAIREALDAEVP